MSEKPNSRESRNYKALQELHKFLSKPQPVLEDQVPKNWIMEHSDDGLTRLWADQNEKKKNPDEPTVISALNIDGREVMHYRNGLDSIRYFQYDDDGYLISESSRNIAGTGWLVSYKYKQTDEGKKLAEATRQNFVTSRDERKRVSTESQDSPFSMLNRFGSEDRAINDAASRNNGVEDLIQTGEDESVTFDKEGNPSSSIDLFY